MSHISTALGCWQSRNIALAVLLATLLAVPHCAWAQGRPGPSADLPKPADAAAPSALVRKAAAGVPRPADFKSEHFLIHSDLPAKEARELLDRMESMLDLIARYWQQPPVGTIECYVVKNPDVWPPEMLPAEMRRRVSQGAGLTSIEALYRSGRVVSAKAVSYAAADHGTPMHEAVHAYCGQAFGRLGPLWYSEGMAEMGQYWKKGDPAVHCPKHVVDHLRRSSPKPLAEILSENPLNATGDSWQNYAWRWALCHLLENNPNYRARFRQLGLGFLNGQRVSFKDVFGAMGDEIAFEYRFFLEHVDVDYRVDLCSWDWKRKFRELSPTAAVTTRVLAASGWQPTGVLVDAGDRYVYSAKGTWQLSADGPELTADGADSGGRLEGIVLANFRLGRPIALGTEGEFAAPESGKLYVRCRDAWNGLADNKGSLSVRIERAAKP